MKHGTDDFVTVSISRFICIVVDATNQHSILSMNDDVMFDIIMKWKAKSS